MAHDESADGATPASLLAAVERETVRVGVDWTAAAPAMRELALRSASVREDAASGAREMTLGLDVTGLLATLRALPDGAGTQRFLAAFAARRTGAEPPPA